MAEEHRVYVRVGDLEAPCLREVELRFEERFVAHAATFPASRASGSSSSLTRTHTPFSWRSSRPRRSRYRIAVSTVSRSPSSTFVVSYQRPGASPAHAHCVSTSLLAAL